MIVSAVGENGPESDRGEGEVGERGGELSRGGPAWYNLLKGTET